MHIVGFAVTFGSFHFPSSRLLALRVHETCRGTKPQQPSCHIIIDRPTIVLLLAEYHRQTLQLNFVAPLYNTPEAQASSTSCRNAFQQKQNRNADPKMATKAVILIGGSSKGRSHASFLTVQRRLLALYRYTHASIDAGQ